MGSLGSKSWTIPLAEGIDGTAAIQWTLVLLAYALHPAIDSAYHRVRSYHAWRRIQKRETVDVTNYHVLAEIFGGRGKWDAARKITVVLWIYALASLGLELSMDLSYLEGEADLLNRPPPLFLKNDTNDTKTNSWQVLPLSEINPEYDGDWRKLGGLNIKETYANSRYYIVTDTKEYIGRDKSDKFVNGEILVAKWGERKKLFYDINGATVKDLECSGETLKEAAVYLGTAEWGDVLDCERGPMPTVETVPPPAIILTSSATGEVSVVVEESSSYPSFLYSVWKAVDADADPVVLTYLFDIHATVRLAEAVVTGVVHGETSGGGCFGLLRAFSETRVKYDEVYGDNLERATPFGENPNGDIGDTALVQDLETIEAGVEINMIALLGLLGVLTLAAVGVTWSICLCRSVGVDVYDRDELLRAVSLQGRASEDPTAEHPPIRILVRREDIGNMTVFINSFHGKQRGRCERLLWRHPPKFVATDNLEPDADGFGGATVPMENTVSLGGVQNDNSLNAVSLAATPVRSNARSMAATPVQGAGRQGPNPFDVMESPDSSRRGGSQKQRQLNDAENGGDSVDSNGRAGK